MSGSTDLGAEVEGRLAEDGTPVLRLAAWESELGLKAGITMGPADLSLFGTDPAAALDGILGLFDALGFGGGVLSRQVHESRVRPHETEVQGLLVDRGYDAHATELAGQLLLVSVADCVPVFLTDLRRSRRVALAHAGWRGTAAGILESSVRYFAQKWGATPSDLAIHCGVAACGECYEVGPEVFHALGIERSEKGPLDLRGVLARRARELGVERVSLSSRCTIHEADRFHSHRASGGSKSRMLAYLGVPDSSPSA